MNSFASRQKTARNLDGLNTATTCQIFPPDKHILWRKTHLFYLRVYRRYFQLSLKVPLKPILRSIQNITINVFHFRLPSRGKSKVKFRKVFQIK